MNHQRLFELRSLWLTPLPPDQTLDMRFWASKTPCGTTLCCAGRAALHPPFMAEGFQLESPWPVFNNQSSWAAVLEFFDLTWSQANWIFSAGSYEDPTPADLVRHIEDVLLGRPFP